MRNWCAPPKPTPLMINILYICMYVLYTTYISINCDG